MSEIFSSPEIPNYPNRYLLMQAFVEAVRDGNTTLTLALIKQMPQIPNMYLATDASEGAPLAIVLAPERHPDLPVDVEAVRALLDAGAPFNTNMQGRPSPLLYAILSGSLPAVELLLERGADPRYELGDWSWHPRDTKSLLVRAIEAKQTAIALRLLEAGADPHGTASHPRPLQAAARMGDVEVTHALIASGADVNAQFSDGSRPFIHGATYFPSVTALMEAAQTENNPVLPVLLNAGADVNAQSSSGQTAIHEATATVFYNPSPGANNARLLLEAGANPNVQGIGNQTPLSNAINGLISFNGEVRSDAVHALVTVLLSHGADPNVPRQGPNDEVSPLSEALYRGDATTILLLLRAGADSHSTSISPSWLLNENSDDEVLRDITFLLREQSHRLSGSAQEHGLRLAARANNLAHAQKLLQNGVNIDATNAQQKTALHIATSRGNHEFVRLLLAHSPNVNAVSNKSKTPLHIAAALGEVEIVQQLLEAGADVQARTHTQATPLIRAAFSSNRKTDQSDLEAFQRSGGEDLQELPQWIAQRNEATIDALLHAGVPVNDTDKEGNTALHYAVERGNPSITQKLLTAGADVHARNNNNRTPLHVVITQGRRKTLIKDNPYVLEATFFAPSPTREERFELDLQNNLKSLKHAEAHDAEVLHHLIEQGADVNVPGYNNFLPLQLAAMYGTPETVQILLDAGADVHATSHGITALQCVFAFGRVKGMMNETEFALKSFPWIEDELRATALDSVRPLDNVLNRGTIQLQVAAREDVRILRVLLQSGAQFPQE